MNAGRRPRHVLAVGIALLGLCGAACRQDMHDQPRYKPLAGSDFFADGRSARPAVAGAVARGQLRADAALYTGKSAGAFVDAIPVAVDLKLVQRGRERYEIYCTPCHGRTGRGDGMVVQRGYRRPPSMHIERLRNEKPGYFFDVITNGFGVMPDYAAQVPVADRWALVAYLRALQLSQHATIDDVPASERAALGTPTGSAGAGSVQHP